MRTAFLLLSLLLCAPALAAQTSLAAAPMDPRLTPAFVESAALGAVVGGLGFAAATYLGNESNSEGRGYTLLAIPVGAVVGGAVGFVGGLIVGAPDRDEGGRAPVRGSPGADRGVTAAVSVPLGPRPR